MQNKIYATVLIYTIDMISPVSSIWDFPDFVEATTAAVACVTPRDACRRRCRLALSLSALTWTWRAPKNLKQPVTTLLPPQDCLYWLDSMLFRLYQKDECDERPLTLEAATSCAVLAAISCEHTINSSNLPLPCTTRSAASLKGHKRVNHTTHNSLFGTFYDWQVP